MTRDNEPWSSVLESKSFWEQYLPESAELDPDVSQFQAAASRRLALFGVSDEQSKAMGRWLYRTDLAHDVDTQTPSPRIVERVDAMMSEAGVSNNDVLRRHLIEKLVVQEAKPPPHKLALPLTHGYRWSIAFDSGVFHELHFPKQREPLLLGFDDPHFQLPILRWQEVESIIGHLGSASAPSWAARFGSLLLLPTVWAAAGDSLERFRGFVETAFIRANVFEPRRLAPLVDALTPSEESDLRWWWDDELGWVNDGNHSRRNPGNQEWTREQFDDFRGFLAAHGISHSTGKPEPR